MDLQQHSFSPGFRAVLSTRDRLLEWFFELALPLWDEHGVDRPGGGFHEHLTAGSFPPSPPQRGGLRRGRVVARQIYVFDVAQRLGWSSDTSDPVSHGGDYLFEHLHQGDGVFHTAVNESSRAPAGGFSLYEHAFYLFALARLMRSSAQRHPIAHTARQCLQRLRRQWGRPDGGFEESVPPTVPLCSNPHMHLLEAALEWMEIAPEADREAWTQLATELVQLCLTRFVDARSGAIREYFDADWQPFSTAGEQRHVVEPGHQFEWAWLLMQWLNSGRCAESQRAACSQAVARLMEIGEVRGVDHARGVVVNEIWDDFSVKDSTAKLWPQTERLKAWCAMLAQSRSATDVERACAGIDVAARGMCRFLAPDLAGLWHETLAADGAFALGPSKASSFYHIVCAIDVLRRTLSAYPTGVVYSAQERFA